MARKRITKNKVDECDVTIKTCKSAGCGCGGCAYFLGALGAAVYYIQNATGFWNGVLGLLKALIWPAMLVYHLLNYIL